MFDYGYSRNPLGGLSTMGTALPICLILAIIGAIVLVFAFLPENKEYKYSGFTLWLYKTFNFRKMFCLGLIKFIYLISVIFITLMGLVTLFSVNFLSGLLSIVLGNIGIRIIYEFLILIFSIHDNIAQINSKTPNNKTPDNE